jgi:hypothetical protein
VPKPPKLQLKVLNLNLPQKILKSLQVRKKPHLLRDKRKKAFLKSRLLSQLLLKKLLKLLPNKILYQ